MNDTVGACSYYNARRAHGYGTRSTRGRESTHGTRRRRRPGSIEDSFVMITENRMGEVPKTRDAEPLSTRTL